MKKPLVVLTGPTAVGKTSLSISLARRLKCEIVSADSMQIYKYMNIGSAKISRAEMDGIPHYLVDELEPHEEFNVVLFQKMAKRAIEEIHSRGNIPLIVGGTGFYIQALTRDIDFAEEPEDLTYRSELENLAAVQGGKYLHNMLQQIDPKSAEIIHANNVKRIIRALEFHKIYGYPISEHNEREKQKESPYNLAYFVLNDQREHLYSRIDKRVDTMMKEGLLDEVRALRDKGYNSNMVSMQGLGYKELLAYLDGEYSLEEAIRIIKRDTRHFAKRQITWFKREQNVIWLNKDLFDYDEDKILENIVNCCHKQGIVSDN